MHWDGNAGQFANTDLGSYHFVVNADVPDMIVETIDETNAEVNPIGLKGVSETGVIGVAIANR